MESFKQYTPIIIILLNRTILQYIFQIIFENAINIAILYKNPSNNGQKSQYCRDCIKKGDY